MALGNMNRKLGEVYGFRDMHVDRRTDTHHNTLLPRQRLYVTKYV